MTANRSAFVLVVGDRRHDVRGAVIRERMMEPFVADLTFVDDRPLDLEAMIGQAAGLIASTLGPDGCPPERRWTGMVRSVRLVRAEPRGLSTYALTLVAPVWNLSQRRNLRIFQHQTELASALEVLREWSIEPEVRLDASTLAARKYRAQSDESDWSFVRRMLEDAGISLWHEEKDGETRVILGDRPQNAPPRPLPIPFVDDLEQHGLFARDLHVVQRVRPGRYTIRDHDYRRPHDYDLSQTAEEGGEVERGLERYHYVPGAFLFSQGSGDDTPAADAKGKYRTDERRGAALAQMRLEAKRASGKVFHFETNALDLRPGSVVHVVGHPRSDLGREKPLLILEAELVGAIGLPLVMRVAAIPADGPYRPPLVTPKPKVRGVQFAKVVALRKDDILTDEFGRARVAFHWDRDRRAGEDSSCLVHVSQPWAGMGFGGVNLPREGHDVIVDFLGGDPDRPIVTGRLFSADNPVPYKLPENKTQSGWRSQSTDGQVGHNEIMMEDRQGAELLRIHAQRDLSTVAKRNATTTVGSNRTQTIGRDDVKLIDKSAVLAVHEGPLTVTSEQSHNTTTFLKTEWRTTKGITWTGLERMVLRGASLQLAAGQSIKATAQSVLTLQVGPSTVKMTPGLIEVFAPHVYLTPPGGGGG